ncbi:hypothetical protein PsorP6_017087 [Peronosclerospora sorghi]|uniref:Uncharacterized protein n=1 Tax=Peronosclerospora sorghi TaxID=230839 RepID=A0ACC0WDB6_9STRA|nr:hypothetical protein PsorP6_017087 [Peronosclerospora sorghi]
MLMRIKSDRKVEALSPDASGDRRRRVETQEDLQPGDLVLRSPAYAAVLRPDRWHVQCHKCFRLTPRLSRCGRCQTVYYCSKACQRADWHVDHCRECNMLKELMQLRLRNDQVMDVMLLGRVLRRKGEERPTPRELVWYEEDIEDQERVLLAALAQKLRLVDASYSMNEMLRMLSRFRNNNFSICDELLFEIGAGCFPLGAMINHSCDPNCAVTRCSKPLQDPESLDAFLDADLHGLPQHIWTQEHPQEVIQALMAASNPAANETGFALQQSHRLDALEKRVEHQRNTLHRENIARLQTLSTLFSAETARGNMAKAIEYGEQMLEFYRRIYHPNHPMTGLHLYTLGDLYFQLAQSGAAARTRKQKSMEYLTEAQRILTITHGKDHRLLTMLADRLKTVGS